MVLQSHECCDASTEGPDNYYWKDHGYMTKERCLAVCLRDVKCKASEVLGFADDVGKYKCYGAILGNEFSVTRSECGTNLDKRCYTKIEKSGL